MLLMFPLLLSFSKMVSYRWYLTDKRIKLVLYLPKQLCRNLKPSTLFLFLSQTGKIYKKTYKRSYGCKIVKALKDLHKLKILIFDPSTMEVKVLGIVKKPYEKVY